MRRQKLILPSLQLRLVGAFVGLAGLALLLQFLLLGQRITSYIARIDGETGALNDEMPVVLLQVLAFSTLLLLPIIFTLGILMTFKLAGPLYRFEQYFKALAAGEKTGPCKIREGDQLQDLCTLINEATAPLREQQAPEEGAEEPLRQAG